MTGAQIGNDRFKNFEGFYTGSGDDTLVGNSGANVFRSGAGNDQIDGKDGNDYLDGESGNDLIQGDLIEHASVAEIIDVMPGQLPIRPILTVTADRATHDARIDRKSVV